MLDRLNAILLSVVLMLAQIAPTLASQNSLISPTTGTVSGLQLTNNYNSAIDSVNTCNSGASAPVNQLSGTPSLGNCWLNSTASPFPWQTYSGSAWLTPFWIDAVNGMTDVKIGGGTASVASASTVDLCGASIAPMAYITISGTTTITSFGSTCKQGHVKIVTFSGVTTLTYNATSMIIPGSANVTTSAGDQAVVVSLGSGNWQVVSYTPVSGGALINPSVDVGDYVMTRLTAPPSSKYLFAYGQAVSRTTYAVYMSATTITQSVTRTTGSPTLTGFTDTTQIPTGAPIEGSGIPTSDTIASCTATTCTMSINATSSGTANVTIFPDGNGDGSTTFNMPNCQGVVLAGRDNMSGTPRGALSSTYYGTNPDALSAFGGSQSHTNTLAETPTNITSSGSATVDVFPVTGGTNIPATNTPISEEPAPSSGGAQVPTTGSSWATVTYMQGTVNLGSTSTNTGGAPHSIVQPTLTANCMIRVLAMIDMPDLPSSFADNDNRAPIADRRRSIA